MVRLPGFGVCWCAAAPQRENVPMHIFSVGLSFCGTDIFLIFSNGCNGCLDAAGPLGSWMVPGRVFQLPAPE